MSSLSITHYFPFPRIRIIRQRISSGARKAYLKAVPDKRFQPICHICGRQATGVHSQKRRWVRDLDFGQTRLWILLSGASHSGHRRGLHPQRPPLPDGGSRLRERASGLGGQRQESPDTEAILLGHDIPTKKKLGSRGDGHVGPLYPGCAEQGPSCQDRLRSLPRGIAIQQGYR